MAFGFLKEVGSQHPDVVRRPDADAHRGASADQPCATARRCHRSGEIESFLGSGYCNQDRERGLRRVVYTGHCCVSGNRQKGLPFQVEPRVSICSRERERRFGSPDLWSQGSQQLSGGFAAASFAAFYSAQEQIEGIDLDGPSCHITFETVSSDWLPGSAHNFPGESR